MKKEGVTYNIPQKKPCTQEELNEFVWQVLSNHLPHTLTDIQQDLGYMRLKQNFMLSSIGIILALCGIILTMLTLRMV